MLNPGVQPAGASNRLPNDTQVGHGGRGGSELEGGTGSGALARLHAIPAPEPESLHRVSWSCTSNFADWHKGAQGKGTNVSEAWRGNFWVGRVEQAADWAQEEGRIDRAGLYIILTSILGFPALHGAAQQVQIQVRQTGASLIRGEYHPKETSNLLWIQQRPCGTSTV